MMITIIKEKTNLKIIFKMYNLYLYPIINSEYIKIKIIMIIFKMQAKFINNNKEFLQNI